MKIKSILPCSCKSKSKAKEINHGVLKWYSYAKVMWRFQIYLWMYLTKLSGTITFLANWKWTQHSGMNTTTKDCLQTITSAWLNYLHCHDLWFQFWGRLCHLWCTFICYHAEKDNVHHGLCKVTVVSHMTQRPIRSEWPTFLFLTCHGVPLGDSDPLSCSLPDTEAHQVTVTHFSVPHKTGRTVRSQWPTFWTSDNPLSDVPID